MAVKPLQSLEIASLSQPPKKMTQHGFILIGGTILLLSLAWLLLVAWEQSRQQALQSQYQQRRYWQSLTASLSSIAIAPHLVWQPVGRQWQCQTAAHRQICLRQHHGDPTLALLRAGPLITHATDPVTLYRWAKIIPQKPSTSPAPEVTKVTLVWITGGWLDSCPEAEPDLCQ